jgi:hypothetical protein
MQKHQYQPASDTLRMKNFRHRFRYQKEQLPSKINFMPKYGKKHQCLLTV